MSLSLLGIFGAGLATFVTPCVLPLIPVYLSALVGGDLSQANRGNRGQLLVRAGLFSIGFIAVFTVLGLTASSLGAAMAKYKGLLQGVGALLILVFGLKFLGVIRIPLLDRVVKGDDTRYQTRFGALNALVMGVVFAAGWTPCVGPVLGSVLTYTAAATSSPWAGAGYLFVYGLGFALPLLLTAAFAEAGLSLLDRIKPHLKRIERVIGALLVVVALGMVADLARNLQTSPASKASWAQKWTTAPDGRRYPVMVEFYADNCSVCERMKPVVAALTEQCHGKKVLVKKVNISKPAAKGLDRSYRLIGVPTFVFLDRQGNEVARLVGEQTEQALKQSLSALRGEPCPGVGRLPGRNNALQRAEKKKAEDSLCLSTNTSATTAETPLKPSDPSGSGTTPSAPSASSPPAACSPASP